MPQFVIRLMYVWSFWSLGAAIEIACEESQYTKFQKTYNRWLSPNFQLSLSIGDKLKTTIYRKPTHTDRLLDQSSYNPSSHKATTIRTLMRRAQLVCDSPVGLQHETDYLNNVFRKNNYNTDFVRRNTHSNTDSNTQTNFGVVTTATIPYIRGTSETIAPVL